MQQPKYAHTSIMILVERVTSENESNERYENWPESYFVI